MKEGKERFEPDYYVGLSVNIGSGSSALTGVSYDSKSVLLIKETKMIYLGKDESGEYV